MSRQRAFLAGLFVLGLAWQQVASGSESVSGWEELEPWTDGLREPSAVQALEDGRVVVADLAADSVALYLPDGGVVWRVDEGLDHPSGLGLGPRGIWVADSGNHRLLLLDRQDGSRLATVELADELHPIDVCVAADGRVWVSATPENRLIVLDQAGAPEAVISELGGSPLSGPRGLAPDPSGGVYVTQALNGQILHLDGAGGQIGLLGRWGLGEGEFLKPKDASLMEGGDLLVVDSHRAIVQRLGPAGAFRQLISSASAPQLLDYPLGITSHGDRLYLADAGSHAVRVFQRSGQAWLGGRFPSAEARFQQRSVRDADPSFVCRQCHDGTSMLAEGNWDPLATNHPLAFDEDVVLPSHFSVSETGGLLCTSCHGVHAPEPEHRLAGMATQVIDFGLGPETERVEATTGNEGCSECHPAYLDTEILYRRKSHPVGLGPPAGTSVELLAEAGARFDGESMGCMTCHPPHGAHADPLLIMAASQGELCTSCHSDHAAGESQHPVELEVDYIRRQAIVNIGGAFAPNGDLTCLSCHDPHQSSAGTLLRTGGAGTDACRSCHENESLQLASGGHGDTGCERCHGMHAAPRGLGDGARLAGVGPQSCLDCHADGSDSPQVDPRASHPLGDELEDGAHGVLPRLTGRLACNTCHAAHGGDPRLLRTGAQAAALCLQCHEEKATVQGTEHDAALVSAGGSDETCLSCHITHGSRERYQVAELRAGVNPADARCLTCHDGGTDATAITHYGHPEGLMLTTGGLPFRYGGPVPYYTPDGERTTNRKIGEITCGTCHDPHRWRHGADEKPGEVDGSEQNSFLRDPDEIVRFCEICHGLEGRPLLAFFHELEYRDDGEDSGEEQP